LENGEMISLSLFENLCRRAENVQLSESQRFAAALRLLLELRTSWKGIVELYEDVLRRQRTMHRTTEPDVKKESRRKHWRGGFGRTSQHAESVWVCEFPATIVSSQHIVPNDVVDGYKELCRKYSELRPLWDQWAKAFCDVRDSLLNITTRDQAIRSAQCILLASIPHDKWKGSKSDYHHDGGINGNLLNRDCVDGLRHTIQLLKRKRKKSKHAGQRVSVLRGQQVVGYRESPYIDSSEKYYRWLCVRDCKHPKFYNRMKLIVGSGANHNTVFQMNVQLRHIDGASPALTKLTELTALNVKPYVSTIPLSRPERIGAVEFIGTMIPIYRIDCYSEREGKGYAWYLGRCGDRRIDAQLNSIDWYHDEELLGNAEVIERVQSRMRYVRNTVLTAEQKRREIAAYARKLLRIEYITMLDSQRAGNCLAGTRQFGAQYLGITLPNSWESIRMDARTILRRWQQKKWEANTLFLKAIDTAYNAVSSQLASVGGFY